MEHRENLYKPATDFRKHRRQMQIKSVEHEELYEKAFLSGEEHDSSEYTFNTTTWD